MLKSLFEKINLFKKKQTVITTNLSMAATACTRFSDNYEIKEELGK